MATLIQQIESKSNKFGKAEDEYLQLSSAENNRITLTVLAGQIILAILLYLLIN